jgi:hypothetical protein
MEAESFSRIDVSNKQKQNEGQFIHFNNCLSFSVWQGVEGANKIYINFGAYANYIISEMSNMINLMQIHGASIIYFPPAEKLNGSLLFRVISSVATSSRF